MKETAFLFIFRLCRMLITVITLTYSAKYFGVSMEKDMWVLTLTLITNILLALWGPLNEIFRTKFVFIREQEGEEVAIRRASSLVGFIFCITIIVSMGLIVGASSIARLMTGNMEEDAVRLFTLLLLLQIPSLLINELTNIGISILNAYEVYYLPEIVGFASGLVNLGAMIIFAPVIGIYSLLIATYFGMVVLFVLVLYFLRQKRISIWRRLVGFNWEDVKVFLLFSLPFFFPYFVGQANTLGEKYLAGMLGSGNVSSLDYSRQFINVLQSVLSSVLTTIMVPMLAKQFINKGETEFVRILKENLMVCLFITGLAVCILSGATEPLCCYFFFRGKVSVESLEMIVLLTRSFGIAFIGVLLYLIFGMSLLSSNKGKFYAMVGVVTQIAILVLNLLLCPYYGVRIFPLSFGAVHFVAGLVMFFGLSVTNPKRLAFYIFKSIAWIFLFVILFAVTNGMFTYQSSFLRMIVNSIALIIIAPIMAEGLGINTRIYTKKILNKYAKK